MSARTIAGLSPRGMVVFGDSVAEGRDDPHPAGGWIGWGNRLAGLLDIPLDEVRNVAASGAKVADVARGQLPLVRRLRPRLVLLGCGMNDVLHGYDKPDLVGDLADVFGWARSTGALTVAAAVPVPPLMERAVLSDFRKKRMWQRLGEFNDELCRSSQLFGVTFLRPEAVAELADESLWSPDGIHLNAAGHAHVAEVIADITRALLSEQSISLGGHG